jgi:Putative transmembrane protein (PGPGW)
MKRFATAIIGGSLTLIGIVLLVLPGPGFVLIAAGLAVLAREFTWAARPLDYAKKRAHEGMDIVARSWFFAVADALAGLVLIAAGIVDIIVGLPLLEVVADVTLMVSGAFLVGTVVYARRSGRRPEPTSP